MKKGIVLGLIALIALVLAMGGGAAVPWRQAQPAPENRLYAPDHILVKFRDGTSEARKSEVHRKHGGAVLDEIPEIGVQIVRVSSGAVPDRARAYETGEPDVEFAEPDYTYEASLIPDDPSFPQQWGLVRIQAPEAWDITRGSAGVRIAVLDTGIDRRHEDLISKINANVNFSTSRRADDVFGHGTHVAGIASAITNNAQGVSGAGFDSTLLNVKVLTDDGVGDAASIARGIVWAVRNGAKVINMSFGAPAPSAAIERAVNFAWNGGAVLVAAAGNTNTNAPQFPAFFANVIAVAATDQSDARAAFSTFGDWVDVAAPGVDILSTLPRAVNRIGPQSYGTLSGTSMAAPHVAGVAALIFAAHPDWTNAQVRAKLEAAVDPASGFLPTIGRINALKSVSP